MLIVELHLLCSMSHQKTVSAVGQFAI